MSDAPSFRGSKVFRVDNQEIKPWPVESIRSHGQENLETRLKKIQDEAYQKGFERGQKEGYQVGVQQGLTEGRRQAQTERDALLQELQAQFDAQMTLFQSPLAQLTDEVKHTLAELLQKIGCVLIRRQIDLTPQVLVTLISQALEFLPQSHQQVVIHVCEADAAYFRELGFLQDKGYRWNIDAALERGDCVIESERTHIDARIEQQIQSALSALSPAQG
jgi:flagellar assembly protein FliH